MSKSFRTSLLPAVIAALTAVLLVTGIAIAAGDGASTAKKKKAVLTSKQKKSINKMIDAKIKKISIPTVPDGPAAYSAKSAADSAVLPNSMSTYTKVLDLAVPAGKYAVNGRVTVSFITNDATNNIGARCNVKDSSSNTLEDLSGSSGPDAFAFLAVIGYANMPLSFVIDTPAATTLSVSCAVGHGTAGTVHDATVGAGQARLTAVRVGSIG